MPYKTVCVSKAKKVVSHPFGLALAEAHHILYPSVPTLRLFKTISTWHFVDDAVSMISSHCS